MIALFGFVYAWLARSTEIDRPLLCLGAIDKLGVLLLLAGLSARGATAGSTVVLASDDLLFASLWFWWPVGTTLRR